MNHEAAKPAPRIRILVVDDHTIVRQGLRSILDLEPDFTVVGEAADGEQATAETDRLDPDVVLLDLMLSDRAPAEGLDVCSALRDLAADFRSAGQLRVSVRVTARQRQLPSAVEHSLFQIAQEGLWNAVRHAHASQAWLSLAYAEDQIRLVVSDDGAGDPAVVGGYLTAVTSGSATRPRCGRGLRNIAERAAELGGEVTVARRRGGGLRISVRVPVEPAGTAAPGAAP